MVTAAKYYKWSHDALCPDAAERRARRQSMPSGPVMDTPTTRVTVSTHSPPPLAVSMVTRAVQLPLQMKYSITPVSIWTLNYIQKTTDWRVQYLASTLILFLLKKKWNEVEIICWSLIDFDYHYTIIVMFSSSILSSVPPTGVSVPQVEAVSSENSLSAQTVPPQQHEDQPNQYQRHQVVIQNTWSIPMTPGTDTEYLINTKDYWMIRK